MSLFDEKTTAKEPRAWVSGLRENQSVDGVYLVVGKSLRYTRSGNAFLALELRDRTDRIQARLWENAEVLEAKVQLDSFVRVVGQVVKFNETLQVNVTELEVVPEDSVDKADFLPTTERDIAEMDREFDSLADCVRSPHLRLLVGSFREDSEFWKLFRQAPAAKQIHHAVIGGLLEHTLSVARLCLQVAALYPSLDGDLLLAGALLHDIGKTRELAWTLRFDYTDEGRLLGHIALGAEMAVERARDIKDFPPEALLRLRHMILSHHGQYEWGSPKRPKTPEALALHFADDLDGKMNTLSSFLRDAEERDPDSHWTPYHRTLDRYLFKGSRGRRGEED